MPGILLAIAYAALLLFWMRRMPFFAQVPGLSMRTIAALFTLKILAGTALWAVYTWVYPDRATADIFKYFDDSAVLYGALWNAPGDFFRMLFGIGNDSPYFTEQYYAVMNNWIRQFENNVYNDSHTMIRFNAVLRLFSFGYYHVHTVFACFLSTAGLVALYRALVPLVKGMERGLMVAVFLWPSMLFWASGVLKESLLVFGLGFFLLGMTGPWNFAKRWRAVLAIAIGTCTMLVVKFYVLLCLIPGLLAWWWWRSNKRGALWKSIVVHVAAVILALVSGTLFPGYDVLYLLAMKQSDFIGMATEVKSGSLMVVPTLEPTLWSFVQNIPSALYLTFLSPFAAMGNGLMGLMSGLENLALLSLPFLAVRYACPRAAINVPVLLFVFSFALLLALLIGWTVPVVGALVRYRIPMLPFLSFAVLLMIDPQRLPRWLLNNRSNH